MATNSWSIGGPSCPHRYGSGRLERPPGTGSSSLMPVCTVCVHYWSVKVRSAVLGTRSRMSQDVVKNTHGTWSEGSKDVCFGPWLLYWYSSTCVCSKVSPFVSTLFLHYLNWWLEPPMCWPLSLSLLGCPLCGTQHWYVYPVDFLTTMSTWKSG